jgi:hypothetical protein
MVGLQAAGKQRVCMSGSPLLLLGIFVGANLLWDSLFGTSISGSSVAEGSEIGSWVFAPNICESGFRRSFYGVRMFSSHEAPALPVTRPNRSSATRSIDNSLGGIFLR